MSANKAKTKKSPLKRAIIIISSILFALVVIAAFFLISNAVAHNMMRVVPDYEMDVEGLEQVLEKDIADWTDEDYDFVYHQTGLTRVYFEGQTTLNTAFILGCQQDIFFEGQTEHDSDFPFSSHDYFPGKYFNMVDLREGDVLISASVHTMGWINGHAALVISGGSSGSARIAEAVSVGTPSRTSGTRWFRQATNFLVLRPKISAGEAAEIADWARENLVGIPYSLFVGFFYPKDQTDNVINTHCSHLVWQAYKAFGYDIDSTGGPVVSPRNIANSDLFEVVQVNGFDMDELWS